MRKTVWFISVSGNLLMEKEICTKGPISLNLWCIGCLLRQRLVAKFIRCLAESISSYKLTQKKIEIFRCKPQR